MLEEAQLDLKPIPAVATNGHSEPKSDDENIAVSSDTDTTALKPDTSSCELNADAEVESIPLAPVDAQIEVDFTPDTANRLTPGQSQSSATRSNYLIIT